MSGSVELSIVPFAAHRPDMTEPSANPQPPDPTRRDFLVQSSAVAVGAVLGTPVVQAAGDPATRPAPTVARVRTEGIVVGRRIHARLLAETLEKSLRLATGKPTGAEAWQSLLAADDIVGLKFNRSGAAGLGTTLPMADAIIQSLTDAGIPPEQIVPIEVPPAVYEEHAVTRPADGWLQEETPFASGSDHLAAVLEQVTAIINVPFLKSHNIAGLTCCLKNLSHGLVKHPARFHANHCSPYIADIVALPAIRNKLKLNIVNALRTVFDGGPEANADGTAALEMLLVSDDPVAADAVGLAELNQQRQGKGLPPIRQEGGKLAYLQAAAEHGLGCADAHSVNVRKARL